MYKWLIGLLVALAASSAAFYFGMNYGADRGVIPSGDKWHCVEATADGSKMMVCYDNAAECLELQALAKQNPNPNLSVGTCQLGEYVVGHGQD